MIKEFIDFLKEYQVIGLAIAVIVGAKVNEVVKAFVDQLIMPVVGMLIPGGDWRQIVIPIGEAKIGVGIILGVTLDFIIVAAIVFVFAKYVLKEQKVVKK